MFGRIIKLLCRIVTSLVGCLVFNSRYHFSCTIGEFLNQIDHKACYLVGAMCYFHTIQQCLTEN